MPCMGGITGTIKQFLFRQQQEREAQEAERKAKEAENLAAKEAADLAAKEAAEAEELAKKKKEEEVRIMFPNDHYPTFFIKKLALNFKTNAYFFISKLTKPWWHKYGGQDWHMGETTPPPEEEMVPEDNFPRVFSMTSNAYTKRGLNKSRPDLSKSMSSINSEEEENKPPAPKKEKEQAKSVYCDFNNERLNESATPQPNISQSSRADSVPLQEMPEKENDSKMNFTEQNADAQNATDDSKNKENYIPSNVLNKGVIKLNKNRDTSQAEKQPEKTNDAQNNFIGDSKIDKDDVNVKIKGAKRDLGSVTEKLIGKNKIKKIKSKKTSAAKKATQSSNQKDDEIVSDKPSVDNNRCATESSPPDTKEVDDIHPETIVNESVQSDETDRQSSPSAHASVPEKKMSTSSRKRHLQASMDNLDRDNVPTDSSQETSNVPSCDISQHPTTNSVSSSHGGGQHIILFIQIIPCYKTLMKMFLLSLLCVLNYVL